MERDKAKAQSDMQMEMFTKASSKMERNKAKECINLPMEKCMMVNGFKENKMVKA